MIRARARANTKVTEDRVCVESFRLIVSVCACVGMGAVILPLWNEMKWGKNDTEIHEFNKKKKIHYTSSHRRPPTMEMNKKTRVKKEKQKKKIAANQQ